MSQKGSADRLKLYKSAIIEKLSDRIFSGSTMLELHRILDLRLHQGYQDDEAIKSLTMRWCTQNSIYMDVDTFLLW